METTSNKSSSQTTSAFYKIFYYTVLSFILIGFFGNLFSFTKTIFFQAFSLPVDSSSLSLIDTGTLGDFLGSQQDDSVSKKARNNGYKRDYINSIFGMAISAAVYLVLNLEYIPKLKKFAIIKRF